MTSAELGRVLKVSETTEIKGQFGLVQSGGTGKILKIIFILQKMSKFLLPPLYTSRGLENQLRNNIYQAHDLICGCKTPKNHLLHLLDPECHPTDSAGGEIIGKENQDADVLEDGILQRIFDEDFTEDDER